ncbi:hypothetical protein [Natronorubrum halophilum]|uniref:hypothetical protein n=1 Tax=Natronorubrum halophilum TaxID=1702106 RepID=UPI001485BDE4|nr:hypothetical protein [Natronorubrum halophilum]
MLDRTERATVALTTVYVLTLAITIRLGNPAVWVAWGALMVLLSGSALLLANRERVSDR